MNSKSLLLLLIAGALALAGLAARNGRLFALAIPFLAYLLIGVIRVPKSPHLIAVRSIAKPEIVVGEQLEVRLRVENRGDTIPNLSLEDPLPPGANRVRSGSPQRRFWFPAGQSVDLAYSLEAARGECIWQSVHAVASDPLGLFDVRSEIPAPGEAVVRPVPLALPRLRFRPRSTLHSSGTVPVQLPGSSTDFLAVREYRPGDPLRRINWRLAARHPGRLFTNEHERSEAADFGLILDTRIPTCPFGSDAELFEQAVGAAASLAECILRDGNRLALLVFGDSMVAAFPGYGKRQLSLILRSLATAAVSTRIPLDYITSFPPQLLGSRSILVIVSTLFSGDLPTYANLRALGHEIILVSPDEVDLSSRSPLAGRADRLSIRAARIERRAELLKMSKLGVHVIDWRVREPLQSVLDALSPQAVHRRNLPV